MVCRSQGATGDVRRDSCRQVSWSLMVLTAVQQCQDLELYALPNGYTNQEAKVRTEYGDTESFSIGKGVRKGCVLSPYLFNLYSDTS